MDCEIFLWGKKNYFLVFYLPLLLLLPPLLPLVAGLVPDLHISVLVLVGFIVNPDTKLVHVGHLGHAIPGVKLEQVGGQPLHLEQHVSVGWGGWGTIIWEPTELWCIWQRGHCKGVFDCWMVFGGLPLNQVPEVAELGEQLLHPVPLHQVVQACHQQNVDATCLPLVFKTEGLLEVFHLAARDSHVVHMNTITLVLKLLAWPIWRCKKHVQCRVGETQLDPLCGVLVVDLLAGGAEAVASRVHGDRLHELGGEMPVVDSTGFLCHWLSVGTDLALWFT